MQSPETQAALTNMLSVVILKLLVVSGEDTDCMVVMSAIDTIYLMLGQIGEPVIQVQGVSDAILTRMKEVFTHKVMKNFKKDMKLLNIQTGNICVDLGNKRYLL
jgi:hypothetical protein